MKQPREARKNSSHLSHGEWVVKGTVDGQSPQMLESGTELEQHSLINIWRVVLLKARMSHET